MAIGARPFVDHGSSYQVSFSVADNRKFCPSSITSRTAVLTHYKVPADEMVFKSRRVNTGVTVLSFNQADGSCVIENLCKKPLKDAFFKSLCCAFCKVVKCGSLFSERTFRRSDESASRATIPR